ncbi:hypothetical protein PAHAL_9G441200 [Panicum hallii]|uniref:Uncharacterized protein n=1 Tax=Panicum hallii TaxID=206008 RepID=A0A2T8I4L3_9POAL|nr:hypothetical protein PAHAL_9G441200 [Panicum hallii]
MAICCSIYGCASICGAGSGGGAGMRRAARACVGKDTCYGGTSGSSRRWRLLASVLATRSSGSCGLEGGRRPVLRTGAVDGAAALTGEGAEQAAALAREGAEHADAERIGPSRDLPTDPWEKVFGWGKQGPPRARM